MDKPLLSVMMPAIRPNNWLNLYNSIEESLGSTNFEIIFVTPYNLPIVLEGKKNIKLVRDWGSPTRAFGIALEMVEGEYVTWAADDGTYHPGQLAKIIELHRSFKDDKLVIAMEQTEAGRHYAASNCHINQHEGIKCNIPDSYVFFPTGLMKTSLYKALGGLDCRYETHAMAHVDFAIRAQKYGVSVHFHREIVLTLTHMMGSSGDHGPIYRAQTFRDEPLLRQLYRDPSYEPVISIDIHNWRKEPLLWTERFKVAADENS